MRISSHFSLEMHVLQFWKCFLILLFWFAVLGWNPGLHLYLTSAQPHPQSLYHLFFIISLGVLCHFYANCYYQFSNLSIVPPIFSVIFFFFFPLYYIFQCSQYTYFPEIVFSFTFSCLIINFVELPSSVLNTLCH